MKSKTIEFKGQLGNYKVIKTDDNSTTLWSEYFDENCHSSSGAIAETVFNYLEPTKVKERAPKIKNFTVLEIGFGQGTGVESTLSTLDQLENVSAKIISLEIDEELVKWAIKNCNKYFTNVPSLSQLKFTSIDGLNCYTANFNSVEILIVCGNARETLPQLGEKGILQSIHAIYLDAFSPKKNKSLWTVEWFCDLKKISNPDVILSTYSASSSVKKGLIEAGWIPENRIGFKRKRQSITARLDGQISTEMDEHLKRSSAMPFRDSEL